jgi:hypothetical protein
LGALVFVREKAEVNFGIPVNQQHDAWSSELDDIWGSCEMDGWMDGWMDRHVAWGQLLGIHCPISVNSVE